MGKFELENSGKKRPALLKKQLARQKVEYQAQISGIAAT